MNKRLCGFIMTILLCLFVGCRDSTVYEEPPESYPDEETSENHLDEGAEEPPTVSRTESEAETSIEEETTVLVVTGPPPFDFESNSVEIVENKMTVDFGHYSDEEIDEILNTYEGYISLWVTFVCPDFDMSRVENWNELTSSEKMRLESDYYTPLIRAIAEEVQLPVERETYNSPFDEVVYRSMADYRAHEADYVRAAQSDLIQSISVFLLLPNHEINLCEVVDASSIYYVDEIQDAVDLYDDTYTGRGVKIGVLEFNVPDRVDHFHNGYYG